jgi:hypothetical protein
MRNVTNFDYKRVAALLPHHCLAEMKKRILIILKFPKSSFLYWLSLSKSKPNKPRLRNETEIYQSCRNLLTF